MKKPSPGGSFYHGPSAARNTIQPEPPVFCIPCVFSTVQHSATIDSQRFRKVNFSGRQGRLRERVFPEGVFISTT
jgi:hypothetical protein